MLVMSDHLNRMLHDHIMCYMHVLDRYQRQTRRHVYIVRYKGIESVSADMLHVVLYLCVQCAEIQEAVQH